MKRTLGKVLAGAVIGSFLMVGSAFAMSVPYYFSRTDLTTDGNGDINLVSANYGSSAFGIYWVDDVTGTPPAVTESLDINFKAAGDVNIGELRWSSNGTAYNVYNEIPPNTGVTNVPDLFGFYFEKNGIRVYTDPSLSTDSVSVTQETKSSYTFSHGEDSASVFVDDIAGTSAPVPEPATMLLFGAGLVGVVGAVRKKARK